MQSAGQSQHHTGQLVAAATGEAGSSHVADSDPDMDEDDSELADVLKRSLEEH